MDYLKTIRPKLMLLTLLTVAALILNSLIIFSIREKYTSKAIFYTINADLYDPKVIFSEVNKINIAPNEEDKFRILSLAYSDSLLEYVINKYNLQEYYNVSKKDIIGLEKTKEFLLEDYKVQFHQESPIILTVSLKDKELAANVANTIVKKIDELNLYFLTAHKLSYINIYSDYIQNINSNLGNISDSLKFIIKKYGLTHSDLTNKPSVEEQISISYDSAIKKITINKTHPSASIGHKDRLKRETVFAEKGGILEIQKSNLEELININRLKQRTLKSLSNKSFSTLYLIQKARVSKENFFLKKILTSIVITLTLLSLGLAIHYLYLSNQKSFHGLNKN